MFFKNVIKRRRRLFSFVSNIEWNLPLKDREIFPQIKETIFTAVPLTMKQHSKRTNSCNGSTSLLVVADVL